MSCLGLSGNSLGALLGPPKTVSETGPFLGASWLDFCGRRGPHFGSHFSSHFWGTVLGPFFDVFFVVVLDPLQAQRPTERRAQGGSDEPRRAIFAAICEGFDMSLLFVFSSVLIPSCSLLVPARPFSLPSGYHFEPQNGSQNGFRHDPFLKPAANHSHSPEISHFL